MSHKGFVSYLYSRALDQTRKSRKKQLEKCGLPVDIMPFLGNPMSWLTTNIWPWSLQARASRGSDGWWIDSQLVHLEPKSGFCRFLVFGFAKILVSKNRWYFNFRPNFRENLGLGDSTNSERWRWLLAEGGKCNQLELQGCRENGTARISRICCHFFRRMLTLVRLLKKSFCDPGQTLQQPPFLATLLTTWMWPKV